MQIYIVHNLPQTQPITLEIKENATGFWAIKNYFSFSMQTYKTDRDIIFKI